MLLKSGDPFQEFFDRHISKVRHALSGVKRGTASSPSFGFGNIGIRECAEGGSLHLDVPQVFERPDLARGAALDERDPAAVRMEGEAGIGQRPLIRVRESAVDDIYLSDRRCAVGGQLYLPRVLNLGESGSEVIISQDIGGGADNVQFTFGNADRVMTLLANDTDLKQATIDISLYHVNSSILLQLWSGFIITFATDGSPQFVVRASDGLYQVTQQYPVSVVSRTRFDDGAGCPYTAHGSGGDPTSCDYYFDSTNGCRAHGMAAYFGGHPAQPQGVRVKDNSTGTWGLGRNNVTATSIVSDSIWGNAIQEIWCNDDGDPGKAFMVKAMIVAGRDESDFYDALGIVGAGPIGAFTGMLVYQNADGYRYVIAPTLDGQTPQGFKVDGGLNVTTNQPTLGLRQVPGNDPVNPTSDSFSLGQGTPQVWGPQMAAGTAFVEIRRTDASGIQPTTADSHDMQVPISEGLSGWVWDSDGNRTAVSGLTNPFWIAVNTLLRALGISGTVPTRLNSVSSITVNQSHARRLERYIETENPRRTERVFSGCQFCRGGF